MSLPDPTATRPPGEADVARRPVMPPSARRREIVALLSAAGLRLAVCSRLSKESRTRLEVGGTGASDDLPGESGNHHQEKEL